jgi:hypothetical protein
MRTFLCDCRNKFSCLVKIVCLAFALWLKRSNKKLVCPFFLLHLPSALMSDEQLLQRLQNQALEDRREPERRDSIDSEDSDEVGF